MSLCPVAMRAREGEVEGGEEDATAAVVAAGHCVTYLQG